MPVIPTFSGFADSSRKAIERNSSYGMRGSRRILRRRLLVTAEADIDAQAPPTVRRSAAPCEREVASGPRATVVRSTRGPSLDAHSLPRSLWSDQAGDASGLPFSTTYVIRILDFAVPGLPPAWGVAGGIWNPSPGFNMRVG